MHFCCVVLLSVISLFVGSDGASPAKMITASLSSHSHVNVAPVLRMLRTNGVQNDEERAPSTSKLVEWMMTPKASQVKKLSIAEKLKVRKWANSQKTSEDIFKRLNLNDGVDKVLTNPNLHLYAAYIDRFNKLNPSNKVTMVDTFTKKYQVEGVIKLLETRTKDANTVKFTSRLRDELASSWVRDLAPPEEIFKLLKLDKNAYKIFTTSSANKDVSNPTLKLYAAFIDRFIKQHPNRKVQMLDLFCKTYTDNGVSKMVEMGLNMRSTKPIASRLRQELLSKWDDSAESAEDVFMILKLDHAGNKLFVTPQINTLYAYVQKTYVGSTDDVMNSVLAGHYGYDGLSKIFLGGQRELGNPLAFRLENTMVKQWLSNEDTPKKVFELLKLNSGAENLLKDPNMKMWESYLTMFNRKHPDDEPITMMQTLTQFYSFKDLSATLEKAKNVPATEDVATKWLYELKVQKLKGPRVPRFRS